MMLRKLIFTTLLAIPFLSFGQDIITMGETNVPPTCNAIFYDDGGATGKHNDTVNLTTTIYPTDPSQTAIQAKFTYISLAKDSLFVYDGTDVNAPLLAKISSGTPNGFTVQATGTNLSGALTFFFKPKNDTTYNDGWIAAISCENICYDYEVDIDYKSPTAADDNYLNICHGTAVNLVASPDYQDVPNAKYEQSLATTTYEWIIDRGKITIADPSSNELNYTFEKAEGHEISVILRDKNGCKEQKDFRVQISNTKFDDSQATYSICDNAIPLELKYGVSEDKTTKIVPSTYTAEPVMGADDTKRFIPRGPYSGAGETPCPNGTYSNTINFTDFPPGATVSKVSDIASICINMEKEDASGLEITITCPNNNNPIGKTSTTLKKVYGSSYSGDLGEPRSIAESPDEDFCDPQALSAAPGIGYWYCWSETYPNIGTMEVNDDVSPGEGGSYTPATDRINHTNYYQPNPNTYNSENGISDLIGCELNGDWTITISNTDQVAGNGWVFGWDISFAPEVTAGDWTYTVGIDNIAIDSNDISITPPADSSILHTQSGRYEYTLTVNDEFGCTVDTNIIVDILETPTIDFGIGNDSVISKCEYDEITLDPNYYGATIYKWAGTGSGSDSTLTVLNSGKYQLTVTNANNDVQCTDSKNIYVQNELGPPVTLGDDICTEDGSYTLELQHIVDPNLPVDGFTILWNTGSTATSIDINKTGTYSVRVEEPAANCPTIDTVEVGVFNGPPVMDKLEDSYTICSHQSVTLDATHDGEMSGHEYTWSTTDSSVGVYQFTPPTKQPDQYNIAVTKKACTEITKNVLIYAQACEVFAPAAFTPNNDGINDFLAFEGLDKFEGVTLIVYSRWGYKVYENNSYQNQWNGEGIAAGTYYFVLKFPEELELEPTNGSFTVLRDE